MAEDLSGKLDRLTSVALTKQHFCLITRKGAHKMCVLLTSSSSSFIPPLTNLAQTGREKADNFCL